ncbi:MAG: OmpA family protein [Rhodocyclaceae bacterium]|nr:OmpA family protein [Rhodocyclaceae bacterium]
MTSALIVAALLAIVLNHQPDPPPAPPADRVVLLPDAKGGTGAVVVRAGGGERVLAEAYAAAEVSPDGRITERRETAESVRARYGALLDAQPPRPVAWTVYFETATQRLTAESRTVFGRIKEEIARRPAPEISVVGHTDRVGRVEDNDALSKRRADAVKSQLVEAGLDPARIDTAGRGEREPLVSTADEVAEPRNRRAEISVR